MRLLRALCLGAFVALGFSVVVPDALAKKCGHIECPEACTCQITPCNKDLNPNCQDVGICVDCPPPTVAPPAEPGGVVPGRPMPGYVIALAGVVVVAVIAGILILGRKGARPGPPGS